MVPLMTDFPKLISVDDHVVEPPNVWSDRLKALVVGVLDALEVPGTIPETVSGTLSGTIVETLPETVSETPPGTYAPPDVQMYRKRHLWLLQQ